MRILGAPTWSWIGKQIEQEVIEKAIKHMSKISEVAELSQKLMEALHQRNSEEVARTFRDVDHFEEEADNIKRDAFKELSEGFIHPIDREELIRLILTGDDIAAYLKGASRRATMANLKELDEEVLKYAVTMSSRISEATKLLREAISIMNTNPRKALELADKVERIEEEVDDIRADALARVFQFCDGSKPSACLISKEIIDSLENSADKCEDVADVIRSIALMHL